MAINPLLASLASSVVDIQSTMLMMSKRSHQKGAAGKEGTDQEEIETDGATYGGSNTICYLEGFHLRWRHRWYLDFVEYDMCFVHGCDFDCLWMRPLIREHAAMGRERCQLLEVPIGRVRQVL